MRQNIISKCITGLIFNTNIKTVKPSRNISNFLTLWFTTLFSPSFLSLQPQTESQLNLIGKKLPRNTTLIITRRYGQLHVSSSSSCNNKKLQDRKSLPQVQLICCHGVKLFLSEDFFSLNIIGFQNLFLFCHSLVLWILRQFKFLGELTTWISSFVTFWFCKFIMLMSYS